MLLRTCPAALVPRASCYGFLTLPHSFAILRTTHDRSLNSRQLQRSAVSACSAASLAVEASTMPLAPRSSSSSSSFPYRHPCLRFRRFSSVQRSVLPLAMVNVDFASPSLVLGVTLIGCGIALLQVRNMQREVSRDADIVVAAMISIVGSTLIFQGWRLDPLLLLCQALTTSVAFWYGLEAFKLRAEVVQEEAQQVPGQQLPPVQDQGLNSQQQDFNSVRSGYLPSAMDRPAPWNQQQQQQPPLTGYGPDSSSSRWGLPPGQSSIPYDAYTGGQANGMQDSMYAGYDPELTDRGQQQYSAAAGGYGGSNGGGYGSNGGFLPQVPPMFDQQQMGEFQAGQQQPPQYQWPPQGNEQQQGLPTSYLQQPQQQQQQQPVWYDAAGFPSNAGMLDSPQQPALYGSLPGLPEPNPARAGLSAQSDGPMVPGISGSDSSSGLPLPAFADQQQQQQGPAMQQGGLQGRVKGRYEQVDDWE